MRFPDQKTSVIVLCNLGSMNPSRLAASVAEVVLGAALGPAAPPPKPEPTAAEAETSEPKAIDFAPFAGRYVCDELGVTYEFVARDGKFFVGAVGLSNDELPWRGKDHFGPPSFDFAFERDASGKPVRIRLDAGRTRNLRFERVR
jgi:hypothetical protein